MNVLVSSGAGFQLPSPPWLATTATVPVPVNDRFVPPESVAGPLATAKVTSSPEEAVALKPIVLVIT